MGAARTYLARKGNALNEEPDEHMGGGIRTNSPAHVMAMEPG